MRWISGIICLNVILMTTSSQVVTRNPFSIYARIIIICKVLIPFFQERKRIALQEITAEAVRLYKGNDFEAAIKSFETALVHYRMMNHIDIHCRVGILPLHMA